MQSLCPKMEIFEKLCSDIVSPEKYERFMTMTKFIDENYQYFPIASTDSLKEHVRHYSNLMNIMINASYHSGDLEMTKSLSENLQAYKKQTSQYLNTIELNAYPGSDPLIKYIGIF